MPLVLPALLFACACVAGPAFFVAAGDLGDQAPLIGADGAAFERAIASPKSDLLVVPGPEIPPGYPSSLVTDVKVGALAKSGRGVVPLVDWGFLRGLLQKFVHLAEVQKIIGRNSTSRSVTTVQTAIPHLSSMMNAFKLPGVKVTDLGKVLDAMTAGMQTWSTDLSHDVIETVQATVDRADGNASLPTRWEMQSFIHSTGGMSEFVQLYSLYSRGLVEGSPVVDLVFCSISDQMELETMSITTTSTMDDKGHYNVTSEVTHTPLTGKDLQQMETQWLYAAADAILNMLQGRPALYVSPRMRVFPFRLSWHGNQEMVQQAAAAEANGEDGFNGIFDGLMSIAKTMSDLWSTAGKLFGSNSHTESIISEGNFNSFNEATNVWLVPGVQIADTMPMFNAILAEWDDETRRVEAQHISAMSFAHGDDSVWTSEGVTWGNNRSDRHCKQESEESEGCAYYLTATFQSADGSNHWAVCSYSADFIVAPTLKLVEDSQSEWFGLFKHQRSAVEVLPPEFTPEDRNDITNFTMSQCLWSLAAAHGVVLPKPQFPEPSAAIVV